MLPLVQPPLHVSWQYHTSPRTANKPSAPRVSSSQGQRLVIDTGHPLSTMSQTARERHNPPPRQKSCAACIKAKRRCDAVYPTCQRCAQRGIECEYLARKRRKAPTSAAPIPTPASSTGLADLNHLSGGIPSPPVAAESLCAGFASGESLFPSCIDTLMPMVDTTDFDQDPSFLSMFDTMEDTNLGLVHQPSVLAAPIHRDIDPIALYQDKLQYALDEIKKMPASMVREMKTPWCHFRLYKSGMPRPMQGTCQHTWPVPVS